MIFNQWLEESKGTMWNLREKYSENGNRECKGPEAGTSW